MKNIFENAKFGDKFKTRDGRMAIFIAPNGYNPHTAFFITSDWVRKSIDISPSLLTYDGHFNVKKDRDIVSRLVDPIDEEKLDKLAKEYSTKECTNILDESCQEILEIGYIAGYRKAKNE